jgi:hypothetical protein
MTINSTTSKKISAIVAEKMPHNNSATSALKMTGMLTRIQNSCKRPPDITI